LLFLLCPLPNGFDLGRAVSNLVPIMVTVRTQASPCAASDGPRRFLAYREPPASSRRLDLYAGWLPLESNPAVFTGFARKIGVPAPWVFVDVLGLDEALLAMVPQPVAAVILLFPCSRRIYDYRRAEEAKTRAAYPSLPAPQSEALAATFHLQQHADFGNACGTIAAVHAISNSRWVLAADTGISASAVPEYAGAAAVCVTQTSHPERPYEAFVRATARLDAAARGRALLAEPNFKVASDAAAEDAVAQTACPARDGPDLDHHFVAFCLVDGRVMEVDGTKWGPIDHGACSEPQHFLSAVARAVEEGFVAVEPDSIEFSLMALCRDGGGIA